MIPPIHHERLVNAPRDRVWAIFTESGQWIGAHGYTPVVGSSFEVHGPPQDGWDGIVYCDVTAIDPGERLAFSWTVPGAPPTFVAFTLAGDGPTTRLTLDHTGWDAFPDEAAAIRDHLDAGWRDGGLPGIAGLAEGS